MSQVKTLYPIGTLVELIQPPLCSWNPWKTRDMAVVTGYNADTDVVLEGDRLNSVDAERVRRVEYTDVYRMTDVRDEKVAGCLLENKPGERIVFLPDGHGSLEYRIAQLDQPMRRVPHYCHAGWLPELLAAGVIELMEEPQEFDSVVDVPRGMVVQYLLDDEPHIGIVYPYLMRSVHGLWMYRAAEQRWIHAPWDTLASDHPWTLGIQKAWSNAKAVLAEAFEYPRLPVVAETLNREILHNA